MSSELKSTNIEKILQSIITKSTENDALNELDKKINIKSFKDGKNYKTQIFGLNNFLSNDETKKFGKTFKKKYGCNCLIQNDSLIFSGEHAENLKKMIIEAGIATKDYIK